MLDTQKNETLLPANPTCKLCGGSGNWHVTLKSTGLVDELTCPCRQSRQQPDPSVCSVTLTDHLQLVAQMRQVTLENNFLRDQLEAYRNPPQPTADIAARIAAAKEAAELRRERLKCLCSLVWNFIENELYVYELPEHRELLQQGLLAIEDRIESESCKLDARCDLLEAAEMERSGRWNDEERDRPEMTAAERQR